MEAARAAARGILLKKGSLSKFDKQLLVMAALIALESAPIGAEPNWLYTGHHHSGAAILAPAIVDDVQRTRDKLGLRHRLLLLQAGALPGSQPPTPGAWAESVM